MKQVLKILPFFGIILVLLITTSVILFGLQALNDRDAADQWVTHSHTVIATADQVLLGLVNMETGFRGYLLTGQDDFLKPYRAGKTQYETAITRMLTLSADNPTQESRWKEIQTLADQWENDWAAKGIQIRQSVNQGQAPSNAIMSYVLSAGGKQMMDNIRAKIAQGRQAEETLLAQRIQAGQTANRWANGMILSGMVFSVILGLAVGLFLARANLKFTEHIELQHLLLEEREKERMGIARDLHDGPIQELLAASFAIQGLAGDGQNPPDAGPLLSVKTTLQKVIADLRAYAMELRSPVLSQFGLEKAIRSHLESFQQKHPNLHVRFLAKQTGDLLPATYRDALFRIFQESLNNVVRHSQATEVDILFQKLNGQALLEMRDNGVGFEPPADWLSLARHGHLGLVGIRERTEAIGGQIEIISHPGRGTCLKVVVPLRG